MEDLFVISDGGLGWYKFPKLWKSHTYGICKGKDLTYQQKVRDSCLFLCCPVTCNTSITKYENGIIMEHGIFLLGIFRKKKYNRKSIISRKKNRLFILKFQIFDFL